MAEINSTEATQTRVILDAATTVEEVGNLLSSYVDLMLDVNLNSDGSDGIPRVYALLVAAQTQLERLATVPDALIGACKQLQPEKSPA